MVLQRHARGTYVLSIPVDQALVLEIGSLGSLAFKSGLYLYVGSAMSGFKARLARHFNRRKMPHWHIDYLTNEVGIAAVAVLANEDRLECKVADSLKNDLSSVHGFGCSDCECDSHLFFAPTEVDVWDHLKAMRAAFGVDIRVLRPREVRSYLRTS